MIISIRRGSLLGQDRANHDQKTRTHAKNDQSDEPIDDNNDESPYSKDHYEEIEPASLFQLHYPGDRDEQSDGKSNGELQNRNQNVEQTLSASTDSDEVTHERKNKADSTRDDQD